MINKIVDKKGNSFPHPYIGNFPDEHGRFGRFGGQFVPETLIPALQELTEAFYKYRNDPQFIKELEEIRSKFMGRPTPLYFARNLSTKYGVQIYLKREDLVHGGAHKLNNTMAQALLAKKMGKKYLIAETGAGQHGFATAIAGAYFGLKTTIFMGEIDMQRQAFNVHRMRLLGADVIPVKSGSKTLKDAVNEGLRYWISHIDNTYYLMGSVVGPHPYPMMVREFQKVIGKEIKTQFEELAENGLNQNKILPDAIIACVGGGSNAMGAFYEFIDDTSVDLWAVEAAGYGIDEGLGKHSVALGKGTEGIFHGARQYLLQDEERNINPTHSISAGLDYPGVGPELCFLKSLHRLKIGSITDDEAISACHELAKTEGIIPALESSHAVAFALKLSKTIKKDAKIIINLSGQGGKDIEQIPLTIKK